ncbi:hypothetical protein [Mucilaginibacter sp. AK015]|uniref:hypothetical protein n=1 Tax=Mucilaginibacter sp. AK015 TaxID=2723072 RepID=UPI0016156649|nr:hypothetical protein [Mucilaginibacter sp. AK015]MBB5395201.1 hypothetical protein [Mucilaginibacter sp. AK015]
MSAVNKTDTNTSYSGGATVVKNMKSHANDPFFVKKAAQAKAIVSKLTLPESDKK